MKILYHHRIASKDGQYVHVAELTRSLRESGHELIIVEPRISDIKFGGESALISKLKSYLPGQLYELIEFCYSFLDLIKVCKAIATSRPDCIYERYSLYLPSGIWAKKIFRLPLVLEINAPLYHERTTHSGLKLGWLAKWTEHYVWRNADMLLPVTRELSKHVEAIGITGEKIQVIHNGINPREFMPKARSAAIEEKFGLHGKTVLGFVGFMREWHGLDRVLEIMQSETDENWHFLVVGDGPARESLEKTADKLGLSGDLTITGLADRDEIVEYLSVMDIALQPDVVPYASPLKLFEYMATGKAILCIDSPNIREVLTDNQDAILFQLDDQKDFANKLLKLFRSGELRAALGNSAQARIQTGQYLWSENARKVENIMTRLLSS